MFINTIFQFITLTLILVKKYLFITEFVTGKQTVTDHVKFLSPVAFLLDLAIIREIIMMIF